MRELCHCGQQAFREREAIISHNYEVWKGGARGLRAKLDQAHAQRIIAITNEGDRGLIALRACQVYVWAINALKAR